MAGQARSRKGVRKPARSYKPVAQELMFVDDLEVWVLYKRVRNATLRIKPPDGRIEASVPVGTPESYIQAFVRQRHDWIVAKQEEISHSTMSRANSATDAQVKEWRAVVEAFTPVLVEKWEPIMHVKAGKLAYRNMTSRWGSCQPATGRICINVRLALYPPECLEYVVVHELCHLLVSGHGPQFYALMDLFLPDWKERRAKLR